MGLAAPHRHLVSPRALPDGSTSWEAEKPEIAARIRDGDPEIGWLGDDRLTLVLNKSFADTDPRRLPRWEVWRAHEEGEPTLVVSCVTQRIDGDQLIMQLALHDARTHDVAAEMLARRDRHRAKVQAEARDRNEELADKLAWGLGRDLGVPAQHGRVFPTG